MADAVLEVAVQFRLCRRNDLRALEWMGLHTYEREVIESAFAAQERGLGAMLLADAGGFPVAQAWLDFADRGSRERPFVWAVRVFPPMQRCGLGAMLMRAVEETALRRGAREIELGAEWDNSDARRFYRRLGYRPAGARTDVERYSFEGYPFRAEFRQELLRKSLPGPGARLELQESGGEARA